jgi:hypothetical protein
MPTSRKAKPEQSPESAVPGTGEAAASAPVTKGRRGEQAAAPRPSATGRRAQAPGAEAVIPDVSVRRVRGAQAPTEAAWPEPQPLPGRAAFGAPGVAPLWAPGAKGAIGTCLGPQSPVWFTVAEGVLTEVYYPRVDLANTRDLQFLLVGPGPDDFF